MKNDGTPLAQGANNDKRTKASDDASWATTSATAIVSLTRGDNIWVNLDHGTVYGQSPHHYTTFMGYRISKN
tara:strand:- start:165 stop:380 length:216 start_codon:yes stop_codon:yes gene_type:complete